MAFQPTSGTKRKLSNEDNDDVDLFQVMNPPKRHTESQRIQNTDIQFEDLEADNESSDSQYEYTFIDDNENNEPYIPINENRIITKHNTNPLKDINENENENDDDADEDNDIDINEFINDNDNNDNDDDLIMNRIKNKEIKSTALDLNWSDEDECIEQYESDIPNNDEKKEDNNNNNEIAWFPTPKEDSNTNKTEDMKYNKSAYNVLYEFHTEWPCLSFDIIRDNLGASRISIPYSLYLVCGTQSNLNYNNNNSNSKRIKNRIQFLKINDIQKTKYDDDKDYINEEKDSKYINITDDEPILQNRDIYTSNNCIVNRIKRQRYNNNTTHLISFMGSDCNLYIYNGTQHILSLDGLCENLDLVTPNMSPIYKSLHCDEGYGLAWNKNNLDIPQLLTGSCAGELRLFQAKSSSFQRLIQFKILKSSIEDIEWSPNNRNIFVSVGIDKCIRIWDIRNNKKEHIARIQNAHLNDINVCSWNPHVDHQHLLLTGSDDNTFKIWDLRKLKNNNNKFSKKLKKCSHYYLSSWHVGPITSIEWHPNDSSSAIVSSEDNQISLWDFSLEEDNSIKNTGAKLKNNINNVKIPPQLTFIHAGQNDIKEVHFHPQIPNLCISTANSGFHIFQPDNLMDSFKNQFKNMSIVD